MTESHWKKWGERDPYFAVLTEDKFRSDNISGHEDEFFASGEVEISRRMDIVARIFGQGRKGTAVDFGCGVGRLIIPLKQHYEHVIGIDIAPGMLAEARKNILKRGITAVSFCSLASEVAGIAKDVDLVHSNIVFQHIEVDTGLSIAGTLLDSLAPNGLSALHFTTRRNLSAYKEVVYRLKHHVPYSHLILNVIQRKQWNEPLMAMNEYSIYKIMELFQRKGVTDIFLEPTFGSSCGFIVYGRKRPS